MEKMTTPDLNSTAKTRSRVIQKAEAHARAKPLAAQAHDAKARAEATAARANNAKFKAQTTTAKAQEAKAGSQSKEAQKGSKLLTPAAIADQASKAEVSIRKAESEARMADNKADVAELEARKAIRNAVAYEHKATCETRMAGECAQQAATLAEAKAKFIVSKVEAEVKRSTAKAKTAEGASDEETHKARKEAYTAASEAKKAKGIAEKAAAAIEAQVKHAKAASQAESLAKIQRAEAADRMVEVNARRAEAEARRAEAKAIKAGHKLKAEAKKSEAQAKKAEALAARAKVALTRVEIKVQAQAEAKRKLHGPPPPKDRLPERRARCMEKKHLSQPGLLEQVQEIFQEVPADGKTKHGSESEISTCDCLMSALAVFSMKYPSLLQFDEHCREDGGCIRHNLQTLYKVQKAPSDTYMRERLDPIDPNAIRPAFKKLFASLQRGKELEEYVFYEDYYLMLGDATGYFSSDKVHCENCCVKVHKDNRITYYHQMMCAAIAHPDYATVIPLCPEPIIKTDGATKNDCERNASERLYRDIRREHPHLRLIVTEDALGSNGPHIRLLKELDMRFILVVKPDGNKSLFEFLNGVERQECIYSDEQFTYKIQFVNKVPLSDAHSDLSVNYIEAWVYDREGKEVYHNSWVTDIDVTKKNAYSLFRGGRAKWKIENETFNTLKNQGYHFEHNYGHGTKNLSTVFVLLMMLAFFIDQIQQSCCGLFQAAWEKMGSKRELWSRLRAYFTTFTIDSWENLWRTMISKHKPSLNTLLDTS